MIIYKDILSGDEVLSDNFKIQDDGILLTCDCRKYLKKKNEDFVLEGANPSAEGGDDAGGADDEAVMVHDIEDQFNLNWLKSEEGMKPPKEAFKSHLKSYMKKVLQKLEAKGASAEDINAFKTGAPNAVKKILANYDNYDVLMGSSMDADAMYILIDFREDGVTPFATLWKHGLEEMKV